MKIESNFLLAVLSFCILSVSCTLAVRKSFGEECNRTTKCDKAAWLSCRDGKCNCSKPDEMLYDEVEGKCVTKSGERCKYGADSEESVLVEITDCVANSICSADGVCECQPKYHEIYNGTCGLSVLYGEQCTDEEDQCSKFVGLKCVDSKCECKDGLFSIEKGLCVGRSQSNCVRNECVDGAICVLGKCLCDSEHFHSVEKTCQPKKNIFEACSRDVECLQTDTIKLRCFAGQCDCLDKFKYSTVQKYEYSVYNRFLTSGGYKPFRIGFVGPFVEMCAPSLGERCPDGYCMENAFCDAEIQDSYTSPISGLCRCKNNQYSPNKDFDYCAKTFDQDCSDDSNCIDDLVCSARRCSCPSPSHQFFDHSTNMCVTKIGGHCTRTSTCVPHSTCVYSSPTSKKGHCECDTDFVVNKDGYCDLTYGTDCSQGNVPCDTIAGLLCINNKCSCPDTMYKYNERFRKCLGLVGAICSKNDESITCKKPDLADLDGGCDATSHSKLVCIENAYCNDELPLQRCDCMAGYVETDDTCVSVTETGTLYGEETISLDDSFERNTTKPQEISYDDGDCNLLHTCKNGQCIRIEWVCDGIVQCDDNSDEMNCPVIERTNTSYASVQVCDVSSYWTCRNGQCIQRSYFCDKRTHCSDRSDEPEGCQQTAECGGNFKCFSGGCVERRRLCNGINDCEDGSDETICAK